jgi:acyl-lipid omega-6 desaturase (Delta-12 desaturase)
MLDSSSSPALRGQTAPHTREIPLTTETSDPGAWRKIFATYQRPSLVRSILEIGLTVAPLAVLWTIAWTAAGAGLWWLALLLAIPSAGFVVRLFMVQHDCGHRSFFKSPLLNDWIGRVAGVFTLTPYDCWRREHAIHHATSGDLDRRGVGAIATLTVEEYRALTPLKRFGYRLYRHPLILFVLGPFWVFFLQQRLPVGLMKEGWRPWLSAMGTNLAIAGTVVAALWFGGWQGLVFVHVPTLMLAASIGVWLFYVQHQFEHAYWARRENWDPTVSALHGSSHYDLPAVLRWITGNIGVHHVHHVSSRIPFYRLQTVLKHHPKLKEVGRLSFLESIRCAGLSLWDEAGQRLISFRQFYRTERGVAAA